MHTVALITVLIVVSTVGCTESLNSPLPVGETQPVSFNTDGLPTMRFDVPGIECPHCSNSACELLAELPGVVDVKADPTAKRATIAIDEATFDSEIIRSALQDKFGEATIVVEQDQEPGTEPSDPS